MLYQSLGMPFAWRFTFYSCLLAAEMLRREGGASILCAGSLSRWRCLAGAGGAGGEATETRCEHPTSGNRRRGRKVLPSRGKGQGSDALSSGAAMPTEYDTQGINPTFPQPARSGVSYNTRERHRLQKEKRASITGSRSPGCSLGSSVSHCPRPRCKKHKNEDNGGASVVCRLPKRGGKGVTASPCPWAPGINNSHGHGQAPLGTGRRRHHPPWTQGHWEPPAAPSPLAHSCCVSAKSDWKAAGSLRHRAAALQPEQGWVLTVCVPSPAWQHLGQARVAVLPALLGDYGQPRSPRGHSGP